MFPLFYFISSKKSSVRAKNILWSKLSFVSASRFYRICLQVKKYLISSGINLGNWITSPTFCFCFTDNIVRIFRIDVWFGIDRNNKYGEYDKILEAHFSFVYIDYFNFEFVLNSWILKTYLELSFEFWLVLKWNGNSEESVDEPASA